MVGENNKQFDPAVFLTTAGSGRAFTRYQARHVFFSQGDKADSVFYLQGGRAKLTVLSKRGKEATVTLLGSGDFFGEESMVAEDSIHTSTASATTACEVLKIALSEM